MIADLIARLSRPADTAPLAPADARLALAALMVRAARSDGDYAEAERAEILAVLADRHLLSAAEAGRLLTEAEAVEARAPDSERFTRAIKNAVPYEERADVLEALWRVALADGTRDPHEDALIRQLSALLGVADRDSALARRRASEG